MSVLRYSFGLIFLTVAAAMIYVGANEQRFTLVDQAITAVCLSTGGVLVWVGWRKGRVQREERHRRRQDRERRLSRRLNGGPDRPASQ